MTPHTAILDLSSSHLAIDMSDHLIGEIIFRRSDMLVDYLIGESTRQNWSIDTVYIYNLCRVGMSNLKRFLERVVESNPSRSIRIHKDFTFVYLEKGFSRRSLEGERYPNTTWNASFTKAAVEHLNEVLSRIRAGCTYEEICEFSFDWNPNR